MSKLACHCGAVVSDVHYPSSTEGEIRTQQDHEQFEEKIEDTIAAFIEAEAAGRRDHWIGTNFNPGYPLDLPIATIVSDIRTRIEAQFMIGISECQRCGRLYVQRRPGANEWVCFEPRSGRYEGILKRKSAEPDSATNQNQPSQSAASPNRSAAGSGG